MHADPGVLPQLGIEEMSAKAGQPNQVAGLYTAEFAWKHLPAALKVVYDQQGHRQEVIDGSTFWKFLTRCTALRNGQTHRVAPPEAGAPQANTDISEVLQSLLAQLTASQMQMPGQQNRDQPLVEITEQLRNSPGKEHLAELWETLTAEVPPPEIQNKLPKVVVVAVDRLGMWFDRRRYARYQRRAERRKRAIERAKRVAAEEEEYLNKKKKQN